MSKVIVKSIAEYDVEQLREQIDYIMQSMPNCDTLCSETKVVLKPNLLAKHAPEAAVTTHPSVVEAVILELKKRGVRNIALIDSAGGLYNERAMSPIYKASGLAEVCERHGVSYGDDYSTVPMRTNGKICNEFTVLTPISEADFIINLPKLKTHAMTTMTCATKNLFGVVSGLLKAELHMRFPSKENFGDMLIDLAGLIKPQLTIVDAIIGMEGDGPAGGIPKRCGLLFAGEDVLSIDLVCAKYMGIEESAIPYLQAAQRRGLCGTYTQELLFDGCTLQPSADYKLPASYSSITFDSRVPRILRPIMPVIVGMVAPKPFIKRALCIGCGKCGQICPASTISIDNGVAVIHKKKCIRCFCCHEVCPVKSIGIRKLGVFNA